MADSSVAIVALAGAVLVLSAAIVLLVALHERAAKAWGAERTTLLNRVLAADPREFAVLQKVTAPPPEASDPVQPEHPMIGTY